MAWKHLVGIVRIFLYDQFPVDFVENITIHERDGLETAEYNCHQSIRSLINDDFISSSDLRQRLIELDFLSLAWHLSNLEWASRSAVRSVLRVRSEPSTPARLCPLGMATAPLIRNRAKIPFQASPIAPLALYVTMYGAMDAQRPCCGAVSGWDGVQLV